MKKGEVRQQTDHDRLMRFARLVFAMRRAWQRAVLYELYEKPESKKYADEQAEQYEKSVDYMTDKILG